MKASIFQNDILYSVIKLSLDNAERFLKDATLLRNSSSFGHATAFAILALEETGKAIYCNWARKGFVKVDNDFLKNLKTHNAKQRVVKEIEKLAILKTEINNYKKGKKGKKFPFKSSLELDFFITKLEKSLKFKSVDGFYGELEKIKQLALYVDVKDGILSEPNMFTKDVCDKFLRFAQFIFLSVKDSLLSKTMNKE